MKKTVQGMLIFALTGTLTIMFLTFGWWYTALSPRETIVLSFDIFAVLFILPAVLRFAICMAGRIRNDRFSYRYVTIHEVRKAAAKNGN